ncbi:Fic family protein [Cetobacterium sp. SF1]|uniref:Fic family protein n=1 Tax=Cetobacterium sp. SF1 TaxID=3417654 RepID=UPI003CF210D1
MDKLQEIYKLKEELDSRRPLNQGEIKRIKENYIIKNTYNSNAIEGNTLTEMETRVILETGITVAKKTLREHLEVKNHAEALLYIEDLKQEVLSEYDIKSIHSIILDGIDRKNAGKYRSVDVRIGGATHEVTPAHLVPQEMTDLLKWYSSEEPTIDRIIEFTCRFINIHPFIDGNGRTSRLLTNLELLKLGYPPITILAIDRLEYYQALDKSYYKDYSEAYEFYYNCILDSLKEYLALTR